MVGTRTTERESRTPSRQRTSVGAPAVDRSGETSHWMLELQRTVGNQAAATLVHTIQRHAGPPNHVHPDPFTSQQKSRAQKIEDYFNRIGYRLFAADPLKARGGGKAPPVDEAMRLEMMEILATAIKHRDDLKEQYLADTKLGLKEHEALLRANQQAFADLPESWRPQGMNEAEIMVKRVRAQFAEEGVANTQHQEDQKQFAALLDPKVLKRDRERAFKKTVDTSNPKLAEKQLAGRAVEVKLRDQRKKALLESYEKQDAMREKAFNEQYKQLIARADELKKKAKKVPTLADSADVLYGQAAGLKAMYQRSKAELEKYRLVVKHAERMTGLEPADAKKRMELYIRTIGITDYDPAELAASVLGGVSAIPGTVGSGAGGLALGAGPIQDLAKSLSEGSPGGRLASFASKDLTGFTGKKTEYTNSAGGTRKFVSGGLGNQIGSIGTAAGNITAFGGRIAALVKTARALSKGDPAERLKAGNEISSNVIGIGDDVVKLGKDGIALAQAFGSSTVGAQAASVLPVFGMVSNLLRLVRDGEQIIDHGVRAKQVGSIKSNASKDEVMKLTSSMVFSRSLRLTSHYTVDAIGTGLGLAGDIVSLTGVGATVGQMVKLSGTVVTGINSAARALGDLYGAGKTKEARTASLLALPGSAEKLLRDDPKAATQAFILKARDGNPLGLQVLATFGVTEDVLKTSSDQNIRALILAKLELDAEPENIGGKVSSGVEMLKSLIPKIGNSIRDFVLKPGEVKELAKAKDAIAYSGNKKRGLGWRIKNFFSSPGTVPEQKLHIRKLIQASNLPEEDKQKYIALTMSREERAEAKKKQKSSLMVISAPETWTKGVIDLTATQVRDAIAMVVDDDAGQVQGALDKFTAETSESVEVESED